MGQVLDFNASKFFEERRVAEVAAIHTYVRNLVVALDTLRNLRFINSLAYKIGMMTASKFSSEESTCAHVKLTEVETAYVQTSGGVPLCPGHTQVITAAQWINACRMIENHLNIGLSFKADEALLMIGSEGMTQERDEHIAKLVKEARAGHTVYEIAT